MADGNKRRQRGGIQRSGRSQHVQDDAYWARLRAQFASGTYPNAGAYANPDTRRVPDSWRQVGEELERSVRSPRLARLPA